MAKSTEEQPNYSHEYSQSWNVLQLVNVTGSQLQNYWIGILSFGSLLAALVAGVSDHDIFLGAPIKLPLVLAQLPLWQFFIAAPLLLLLFHVFVLVKYKLLVDALEELRALRRRKKTESDRHPLEMEQLMGTSVLLRGIAAEYGTIFSVAFALRSVSIISILVLPVALLLYIQVAFLRYQSFSISFVHFAILVLDLAACATFVKGALKSKSFLLFALLAFSASVSSYWAMIDHVRWPEQRNADCKTGLLSDWMRLRFLALDPLNNDFVDDNDLANVIGRVRVPMILQERNYVGAELSYADIRGVDLLGANFSGANLIATRFDGAVLTRTKFDESCLFYASFTDTQGDDASFKSAKLKNANLSGAALKNADFTDANLTDAHFDGADLKHAKFGGSDLLRTRFIGARLGDTGFCKTMNLETASFLGVHIDKGEKKPSELCSKDLVPKTTIALKDLICEAGTYPHVADMIVHSRKLKDVMDDATARDILENRCTGGCPGARQLEPHLVSKLWRRAVSSKDRFGSYRFGSNELPDYFLDCDLWKNLKD